MGQFSALLGGIWRFHVPPNRVDTESISATHGCEGETVSGPQRSRPGTAVEALITFLEGVRSLGAALGEERFVWSAQGMSRLLESLLVSWFHGCKGTASPSQSRPPFHSSTFPSFHLTSNLF